MNRARRKLPGLVLLKACLMVAWCPVLFAEEAAEKPTPGKQVAASTKLKLPAGSDPATVTMRYWIYLPQDYEANGTKKFPLLLFLHGSGERGNNLDAVKKHGPPKLVESQSDFPFVTVSPQCPTDQRWQASELLALVAHLEQTLQLDPQRLYITGLSMGGSGTWSLIAARPDLFAAAIPICGGGGGEDFAAQAERYVKLPIWAYYGDQDRPEGLKQCQATIAAIQAAGNKEAHMTIYPNVGHDSWTQTYENDDVYRWLLEQQRAKD